MTLAGLGKLLGLVACFATVYILAHIVHRLYFCRIAHIPGPKLAALTILYPAYWDFWPHNGQFLAHCRELHRRYGPIIRIGPDEVHINDATFYKEMYGSVTNRRHKSPLYFWMHGTGVFGDSSVFATLDHDVHRMRREAFATFFRKQSVQHLEPRLREMILLLKQRLLERTGQSVDFKSAFSALTLDVVSTVCFGRGLGALDSPDFARRWETMRRDTEKMQPALRAFPALSRRLVRLPPWILAWAPGFDSVTEFISITNQAAFAAMNEAVRDIGQNGAIYHGADSEKGALPPTVLHTLLSSDALPEHEKTWERVAGEGIVLIMGGFGTTSRTLAVTVYHVLNNETIHSRLSRELRTIMPTAQSPLPTIAQLEQLPYLTAVLREGARLGHGVPERLTRIAPDEDLVYTDHLTGRTYGIPRGVTFSQSSWLVHTDEKFYPDPFTFDPDRYYRPDGRITAAQRNLVAFGKGTRACVGLNLGYAQLYLTMAALIGSVAMEDDSRITARVATSDGEKIDAGNPVEDGRGIFVKVLGEL